MSFTAAVALVLWAAAAPPARKVDEDRVLHAQVLLDRAHFSPGEIDGREGSATRAAVQSFQLAHDLEPTGLVDEATWGLLTRDDAPPLVLRKLSAADVEGPFAPVPDDMMEKSRLPVLGYQSPLEQLAEAVHSSPALLTRLNPHASFTREGESVRVPNVDVPRAAAPATKVVVDGRRRSVTAYGPDGRVVAAYPASVGSEHDPLPAGEWNVTGVARNPPFFYNPELFWDADPTHAKARIAPGPNNPVGPVWIDLSREHYGIHGTPEPGSVGRTQSHGCIRLTNWDALELADLVGEGTPVVLLPSQ